MNQGVIPKKEWYLVYTKPSKEIEAKQQLIKQCYTVFLPQIAVKRRKRSQYVTVIEPMFKRYLFVQLDQSVDDWGPIRSTIGVSHLVKFGHIPARVPDQLIELLQNYQTDSEKAQAADEPLFELGDELIVLDGPLAGYEAIFQSQKGEDRVIVLLKLADQFTRVQVHTDSVGKA